MVEAMGAQIAEGDGNDALAAHRIMQDAVDQVRAGNGPYFLEFSTYRWREHCGPNYDNDIGYRTQQEFQDWHSREPIARLESALLQTAPVVMDKMKADVNAEVLAAFESAEAAPFPDQSDAYQGVYA